MSRTLRTAPSPHVGLIFQNNNGDQFIITDSCISAVNPPLAPDELEALEYVPFDIMVQSTFENAVNNTPNLMRLPEQGGEINAIAEEIQEAIENFE